MKINPKFAKQSEANPNHHLWNNNGTYYVHFTTYPTPITKERIRQSLKTHDLTRARELRDEVLAGLEVTRWRI